MNIVTLLRTPILKTICERLRVLDPFTPRLSLTDSAKNKLWIYTCREANEAINQVRTESWKNLLQDVMSNSDGPNM